MNKSMVLDVYSADRVGGIHGACEGEYGFKKVIQRVVLKAWSESASVMVCSNVCRGAGSRCGWILQALMWAMVHSFGPANPVDAPVGLLRRLAQLAVGGFL